MKKQLSLIISLILCLLLFSSCATMSPSQPASNSLAPISFPSLSNLPPMPELGPKPITIIHTNDVHGYDSAIDALSGEESEYVIGRATVSTIRYTYSPNTPTFLLDAGDATQGVFFATANKGEAAIDIMGAAGYDAMTLGNHEFDYGWFWLSNLIGMADFPILSQLNDTEAQELENLFTHTVIERDGVRLGVFGITTPETQFKSDGGFGRDFGTVDSIIAHANNMVNTLRNDENADYVICLSHLGINDMGYGTSYDIRDNVEGIDLIIDGHSHTPLADIENIEGKTQITSAGANGELVGIAQLSNVNGITQVHLENLDKSATSQYTPDSFVAEVTEQWATRVAEEGNKVVAQIPFDITVARENERTQETIMGNIITDAMREFSGADIAMQNGGSIRDIELTAGDVTQAQLITILPYGNVLQMAEVTGSTILEMLEQSASLYPEPNGGFAHVSGMQYTFNASAPAGQRVTQVLVGGQPLDENATYTLCTNDFTAAGGDLYTMLVEPFSTQLPLAQPEYAALDQALVEYLSLYQDELSPELEGRIMILMT